MIFLSTNCVNFYDFNLYSFGDLTISIKIGFFCAFFLYNLQSKPNAIQFSENLTKYVRDKIMQLQ